MRHTITLYRTAQAWMSVNSDPQVRELFGTDVLPTAFAAAADESTVLARIQQLNPDCDVVIANRRGWYDYERDVVIDNRHYA